MDPTRFDDLTRWMVRPMRRRRLLAGVATLLAGATAIPRLARAGVCNNGNCPDGPCCAADGAGFSACCGPPEACCGPTCYPPTTYYCADPEKGYICGNDSTYCPGTFTTRCCPNGDSACCGGECCNSLRGEYCGVPERGDCCESYEIVCPSSAEPGRRFCFDPRNVDCGLGEVFDPTTCLCKACEAGQVLCKGACVAACPDGQPPDPETCACACSAPEGRVGAAAACPDCPSGQFPCLLGGEFQECCDGACCFGPDNASVTCCHPDQTCCGGVCCGGFGRSNEVCAAPGRCGCAAGWEECGGKCRPRCGGGGERTPTDCTCRCRGDRPILCKGTCLAKCPRGKSLDRATCRCKRNRRR